MCLIIVEPDCSVKKLIQGWRGGKIHKSKTLIHPESLLAKYLKRFRVSGIFLSVGLGTSGRIK